MRSSPTNIRIAMSTTLASPQQDAAQTSSYDKTTIRLHWAIVVLVALQWLGAELVDFLPDRTARQLYWSTHITLGTLFAAVVIAHVWWRMTGGRRLPQSNEDGWKAATRVMHTVLFWLPALLAALGIGIVLARGWTLFHTITIPMVPGGSKHLAGQIHAVHEWTAHVVVFLATGHAAAALFHHYLLRDGVLARMRPTLQQRTS
ncbi:MAG TPA: cytochrome b/b6 domain-containing protein [Rhizomicrobium sp.]|nr:cytochrome b/b6 domain-containing protein [Rhizomicrobium sp.]